MPKEIEIEENKKIRCYNKVLQLRREIRENMGNF
jgi:hypothetical protein